MAIKKTKFLLTLNQLQDIKYAFEDSMDMNGDDTAYHKRLDKIWNLVKEARQGEPHAET